MTIETRNTVVADDAINSFYRAVRQAEYLVASRKPHFIIAPLRGAEPIVKSMRVISKSEGRDLPEVIFVETGSIDYRFQDGQRQGPVPLRVEKKI